VWWRNVQLFGRVFESLPLVTEPNTNYFAIKVQLVSKLRHLGTYRHVHTDISAENGKSAHMHRQISTDQSQSMLLFNCQILYLSTYIGRQYMQKNIYTCKWTEIGRQLNPFQTAHWHWLAIIWWRLLPSSTLSGIAQTTVEGLAVNWCHKSVEGRLAIGYGGQFHFSGRPHNQTSQFWSSQTSVVTAESFSDRPGPL